MSQTNLFDTTHNEKNDETELFNQFVSNDECSTCGSTVDNTDDFSGVKMCNGCLSRLVGRER